MPTRIALQVEGAIALRTSHHRIWLERIECATCVRRLCPCHTSSFLAIVAFMEDALFTELRPKFSDFSMCRLSRTREKFVEIETSLFRARIAGDGTPLAGPLTIKGGFPFCRPHNHHLQQGAQVTHVELWRNHQVPTIAKPHFNARSHCCAGGLSVSGVGTLVLRFRASGRGCAHVDDQILGMPNPYPYPHLEH